MDNNTPQADILNEAEELTVNEEQEVKESPKRERRKLSYFFTDGIIMCWLSMLTECIYNAFVNGFFGKIFTSYSSLQSSFERGYLKSNVLGNRKLGSSLRQTRKVFAEGFERSFLLSNTKRFIKVLLETPLKNYGNFTLCFGLYTIFAFFLKRFIVMAGSATLVDFIVGAVFVVVAIPLLTSKISLAEALLESVCSRLLLCEAFGIRDKSFYVPAKQSRTRANLSIILGIVCGIFTLVIDPIYLPLLALVVISLTVIMSVPEIGVVVALFSLPFLSLFDSPSLMLALIVLVSAFGYFVKIVRGKRIMRFEILDVAMLMLGVVIFFSGIFTAGKGASLYESLLACSLMLAYFLIANMMRTKKWVDRCVLALVSSAGVTAVIGVLEYFFGEISTQWLDVTYFSDIRTRVVSLFDNSNVLAFYLVIIFPLALDLVFKASRRRERFLALFSVSAIVLCTVFTWSRGAWIGLIASAIMYLLINTRVVIKAFVGLCLALPVLSIVLPSSVIKRFLSIGDLADSSTYYRVLTWRGSLRAIADNVFGGYGYGMSSFEAVYPAYAIAGIEAAEHTHSLYLQLLFGTGLVGLILFLAVIILFAQKNFEFFVREDDKRGVGTAAAAFSAVIAALVMGLFDNIWYNSRVMLLFFAVMGIACAMIRISDENSVRRRVEVECDKTSAYIDI